jgi:DNA (cytosine-5)-methyltransferase 1
LTAGWKAFEHHLAKKNIKADLVQLNGYYQYEPKICMMVHIPDHASSQIQNPASLAIISKVLEGRGVRQILSLEDLSVLWNVSTDDAVKSLIMLKKAGYEVRSEFTNNQIPQRHVLIPYAFPTFTPNSVQLRKPLFPEAFVQQFLSAEKRTMTR